MVDTGLRPRPGFGTFLQSDTNAGGNALTYHQYQRLLRSQKVALLQEKRARAYIPGYKKPVGSREAPQSWTRQIFKLQAESGSPVQPSDGTQQLAAPTELAPKLSPPALHEPQSKNSLVAITHGREQGGRKEVGGHPKALTERLPRVVSRGERLVKSATVRERRQTCPEQVSSSRLPARPKTAGGLVDVNMSSDAVTMVPQPLGSAADGRATPGHHRALTEGVEIADLELPAVLDKSVDERDVLAKAFRWTTSTQRAFDEVGWSERMASPVPPPTTTVERFPDPVSHRLTLRRYHSAPAAWQMFGPEWDYTQTRVGTYAVGEPHRIVFASAHRKTQQIPGYTGCIPGIGECDNITGEFNPTLLIRTLKPRHTNISRRANIPGYAGHVHWTTTQPAHTTLPATHLPSTARAHRPLPLEEEPSPYGRSGVLSKTITLVSPHNPFNKIEH